MATWYSAYRTPPNGGIGYRLAYTINVVSQSIEDNTTTVSWSLVLQKSGSGQGFYMYTATWSAYAGGVTLVTGGPQYRPNSPWTGNSTFTVASGTKVLEHDSDGSYTDKSVSASYETARVDWGPGALTVSGALTLPTIPRATTPVLSASTANAGTSVTITTTPATPAFHHEIHWAFNALDNKNAGLSGGGGSAAGTDGSTGRWVTGTGTRTTTFAIPLSALQQIPNATSGTASIVVDTYSDTTLIGSKTLSLTIQVGAGVIPTLTGTTATEGTTSPDVATIVGAYVQGISKLNISVDGESGAQGSTIASYLISAAGQTGTTDPWLTAPITSSGTVPVTASVTDSRGRVSNSVVTNETFLPYQAPRATGGISFTRALSDGSPSEDEGTFVLFQNPTLSATSLVVGTEKNRVGYKIEFLEFGMGDPLNPAAYSVDTATTWSSTVSHTGDILSTKTDYSAQSAYYIKFTILDNLTHSEQILVLTKGRVLQHWNGSDGLGFGGYHTTSDPAFVQTFGTMAQAQDGATLNQVLDESDLNDTPLTGTTSAEGMVIQNSPVTAEPRLALKRELSSGQDAEGLVYLANYDIPVLSLAANKGDFNAGSVLRMLSREDDTSRPEFLLRTQNQQRSMPPRLVFPTLANLNTYTGTTGQVCVVTSDSNPANNGDYIWNGAGWEHKVIYASFAQTAVQSVPNTTTVGVIFNQDKMAIGDIDITSFPNGIKINVAGYYRITSSISFEPPGSGTGYAIIYFRRIIAATSVDENNFHASAPLPSTGTAVRVLGEIPEMYLESGDIIYVQARHSRGATGQINFPGGLGPRGYLTVERILR